jgi:hypothetical protein
MYGGAVPPYSRTAHAAAFAEGRRQREASRMRRRQAHGWPAGHPGRPYGGPPHGGRSVLPLIALLLLLPIFGGVGNLLLAAAATFAVGAVITALLATAAPVLLVGTVAFVAVRHHRRRTALRRGGAAGTAPLPARPAAPPRPDAVWARARQRFHTLRGEYAAYECDAMQVLRLPALADVAVPSTARFVDAFAEAQALETDAFPGGSHAAGFVAAVDRAERAWRAAREAAERIRLSGLSPAERSTVERVIKLLTVARDSDSDAERLAAYGRARSELARLDRAGVVHVPRPAKAALDDAAHPALPA